MEAFPELKDPDSVFNHAFIQRVNKIKQTNPDFLDDPKWPFLLAQQINNSDMALIPGLNLKPVEPAIKIEPYDELDKANVRLDCVRENMSSISSKAHCREIELSVFQIQSEKALVSVEAIFVHGGAGKETLVSAGSKKLEAGVGTVSFSSDEGNSAQPSKPNNDQKVVGWLARAIAEDGRILGVAASSEKYLLIAKKP